jgi:hypothetical protein
VIGNSEEVVEHSEEPRSIDFLLSILSLRVLLPCDAKREADEASAEPSIKLIVFFIKSDSIFTKREVI